MKKQWQPFWNNYLAHDPATEDDLFKQVAQTVNRNPISPVVLDLMLCRIQSQLRLSPQDHLVEFCCGTGLFSHRLASHVERLTGIDFAPRLIAAARQMKTRPNIVYIEGDATDPLSSFISQGEFPAKYLMNHSLAYFEVSQLRVILNNLLEYLKDRPFSFLIAGIPNFDLKWYFYDTPERRSRHLKNCKDPENTNDGLGRWWRPSEIRQLCEQMGLSLSIENQPPELCHYRMDALISSSNFKSCRNQTEQPQTFQFQSIPSPALTPPTVPVFLRSLVESDFACTYRWHNDADLYDTLGDNYRKVKIAEEIDWLRRKSAETAEEINLAICLSSTDEHIGCIYLRGIDWKRRCGELHIFIGSALNRGKGYGQAAVRLLLDKAFRDLRLNRVTLEVLADNTAAIRAYEKCGFTLDHVSDNRIFKHGKPKNLLIMGINSTKHNHAEAQSE